MPKSTKETKKVSKKPKKQKKDKPTAAVKTVFVFPLKEVILFPHSRLPLHIFEPRYLEMVRRALEEKIEIAITPPLEKTGEKTGEEKEKSGSNYKGILAGAGHPHILKEHPDGRLIILLAGSSKVRLGKTIQTDPVIECEAEVIEENISLRSELRFKLHRVRQNLEKWASLNIEDHQTQEQFIESLQTPNNVIETASLIFLESRSDQQELLEIDDINLMLETLLQMLPPEEVLFSDEAPAQSEDESLT